MRGPCKDISPEPDRGPVPGATLRPVREVKVTIARDKKQSGVWVVSYDTPGVRKSSKEEEGGGARWYLRSSKESLKDVPSEKRTKDVCFLLKS